MSYPVRSIAAKIYWHANSKGEVLNPLKLIKLTYLAHGWYLGLTGNPLLDEPPQVYKYGAYVSGLYEALKGYGSRPIPEREFLFDSYTLPQDVCDFIYQIWKVYGRFTSLQLSSLTARDSCIKETWKESGNRYKAIQIPEDRILQCYRSKAKVASE